MNVTLRQIVTQRALEQCEYCLYPEKIHSGVLHLDHIIPPQYGGKHTAENRALACSNCNLKKSDKINGVDPVTRQTVRLFHPRQDGWKEHFVLHRQTGAIEGLTEIGRATAHELGMNAPTQVNMRLALIQAKLL
jgi:hypothetical protein